MTFEKIFDKFRKDFFTFFENSTVNLGRKTTKTRKAFINTAKAKFDAFFIASTVISDDVEQKNDKQASTKKSESIICLKPKDRKKTLDIGKGVHAMTSTESMRADEQLNRSPFGTKTSEGK